MSEKIDLTQFEGIKEWEVERRLDGGYAIKTGRDNFSLDEAETIAKLPTLIAELKRCYAMLDAIAYEVAPCSECGGHREEEGLFHDCQNYCRCEEFDAS